MLFTRDTKGKLRQFTLDSGNIQDEIDQVSTKQGIVINNVTPILCLVQGGKV